MMEAIRDKDFSYSGTYFVATGDGTKKMYRDPDSRLWYEDTGGHWTEHFLGYTKDEALAKLEKLYGPPIGPQRILRGRRR